MIELSEPRLTYILEAIQETARDVRANTEVQKDIRDLLQELLWKLPDKIQ